MPETIQRSFTGGEISPALQSRATLTKYATGLNLCENMFIRSQGGAYSRPGLRFICEVGDSATTGRLIPFSFNTQQTYILLFQNLTMRVIKDGGLVLKPAATVTNITQANPAVITTSSAHGFVTGETVTMSGVVGMVEINGLSSTITVLTTTTFQLDTIDSTLFTAYTSGGSAQSDGIYELTTTYTTAELSRLGYTQSADVMTITHPNHDPQNLARTADNAWSINAINYASTVTAPGALTLTAIGTGAGTYNKSYTYVVTTIDANGIESLPSPSNSITTPSLTTTAGVRVTWGAVTGADYYRVYKDPSNGTGVYGWIGDTKNATFDDFNIAPIVSDAPPQDRTPFSAANDKPSTVTYYQQRQVFGNTNNEPQAIYTTQTGNFQSLRTSNPARDDDAVTFTIAAQQVNEIRHLVPLDKLIILTSGAEWKINESQDGILTPSTIGAKPQSYNGAAWVKPVVVNNTAIYVQQKNARVRDLTYQLNVDSYTGNDLSIMAEHLIDGYMITEMAYADEPYGILWCVRNDGILLGLTYQREHQVWAWHRHTTNGTFESIATVSENNRDAPYVIVKRTINGTTKRYVERIEPVESTLAEDAFYVDSGLSFTGLVANISDATATNPIVITTTTAHGFTAGMQVKITDVIGMVEINFGVYTVANPTTYTFELLGIDGTAFTAYTSGGIVKEVVTSITNLGHLENEPVVALCDGNYVTGLTVTGGTVTLSTAANKIHIGLYYVPAIELLDLDTESPTETLKAQEISVSKVTIEMQSSRGGFVGARQDSESGLATIFKEIKPRFDADAYTTIALRTYKADVFIEPAWTKGGGVRIEQRAPLPMNILSVIPRVDLGGN